MVRTILAAFCLLLVAAGARAEAPAAKPPRVPVGTARANAEANALVAEGKFAEAAKRYREEALRRPENAVLQQNLAGALARSGQMEEGLAAYQQALRFAKGPQAKASVLYDLGNALAVSGQLQPALQTYMASMLLNPEDMDARHNYERVLREIQQQQQQQQDHQQNQDQQQEQPPKEGQGEDSGQNEEQDRQPQPEPQPGEQQQQELPQQMEPLPEGEQMDPEDAKRLLDAMLEEEKELQAERNRQLQPRDPRIEKDW
jgi:tetratricopeptide (TPR) repeat protein